MSGWLSLGGLFGSRPPGPQSVSPQPPSSPSPLSGEQGSEEEEEQAHDDDDGGVDDASDVRNPCVDRTLCWHTRDGAAEHVKRWAARVMGFTARA